GCVKRITEGGIIDLCRVQLSESGPLDKLAACVPDLGAAAIVDRQTQGQPSVPPAPSSCFVDFIENVVGQFRAPADDLDPNVLVHDLGALLKEIAIEQCHQEFDLGGRPLPILGTETI